MSTYVINSCFLESLNDKLYLTEVLLKFAQQNSYKVAIDSEKKVIDIYYEIASERPEIASWLSIMSFKPTSFEEIQLVNSTYGNNLELFLNLASSIARYNCIIVYSVQVFYDYEFVDDGTIKYFGKQIRVIDKDEAIHELREEKIINHISNSIFNDGGGNVGNVTMG